MQKKRKDILSAFKKKGFIEEQGTKHIILKLKVGGKYTAISTFISRGSSYKDYGNSLLGKMASQLKLDLSDLGDFIDCHISEEEYVEILKKSGSL